MKTDNSAELNPYFRKSIKGKSQKISVLLIVLLISLNCFAQRIIVPDDHPTIQTAINASSDGDSIIVEPGRYFENINLRGKNIVLGSRFLTTNNREFISTTIIDGSRPVHPDTASCILIISGEDSTCVIQGLTICNGTGTKWLDEHGAGTYYEGGGILITNSSPIIKYNVICNNYAIRSDAGTTSAGGGGIRVGDGNPYILNNIIMSNEGMYGGGIVLNFTGGVIRNNIVYNNSVYEAVAGKPTFGGAGIWAYNIMGNAKRIIENNTIIGNHVSGGGSTSAGRGGGILLSDTRADIRNNIVWGNSATTHAYDQISPNSYTLTYITYNNIMNGRARIGEIKTNPDFAESGLYLLSNSANIDSGNPDEIYFDPADINNILIASPPAKGERINDIGAYGGPGSDSLPVIPVFEKVNINANIDFGELSFGSDSIFPMLIENLGTRVVNIDRISFTDNSLNELEITNTISQNTYPFKPDTISIKWTPSQQSGIMQDTLLIYHSMTSIDNPYKVIVEGVRVGGLSANGIWSPNMVKSHINNLFPNPISNSLTLDYTIAKDSQISINLYDMMGKEIKNLLNQYVSAGNYKTEFEVNNLLSGIYLISLKTNGNIDNKQLIIK